MRVSSRSNVEHGNGSRVRAFLIADIRDYATFTREQGEEEKTLHGFLLMTHCIGTTELPPNPPGSDSWRASSVMNEVESTRDITTLGCAQY